MSMVNITGRSIFDFLTSNGVNKENDKQYNIYSLEVSDVLLKTALNITGKLSCLPLRIRNSGGCLEADLIFPAASAETQTRVARCVRHQG